VYLQVGMSTVGGDGGGGGTNKEDKVEIRCTDKEDIRMIRDFFSNISRFTQVHQNVSLISFS